MNLIIDEGNTFIKIYFFQDNEILYSKKILTSNRNKIKEVINHEFDKIINIILSTVADGENFYLKLFEGKNLLILDAHTPLPIKNNYKSPKTLGKDRLAAATGAAFLFPRKNILIIDAGTAITFDIVTSKGIYIGGNISPGMKLRFTALNKFTSKLPLVEASDKFSIIGTSTYEAILNGVINGILFEIDGYIKLLQSIYKQLTVVLTGGDMFFFEKKIKNHIFAEANLVPIGLNSILRFNLKRFKTL